MEIDLLQILLIMRIILFPIFNLLDKTHSKTS